MAHKHIEIDKAQSSKHADAPCGDVVACDRSAAATTIICADGIGSGIKANLAATLCVARLTELLRCGFSLREAFGRLCATMNLWRDPHMPYAAFSVARVLPHGEATILTYEAPPPILIGQRHADVLPHHTLTLGEALVGESHWRMTEGTGLLLMSDGITQAGLGSVLHEGWGSQGVARFVTDRLNDGLAMQEIPQCVHKQACEYWGSSSGDDCTVALASCRKGEVVNIFTGPPSTPADDRSVASRFLRLEGAKIVCGATTAKIVATQLRKPVAVEQDAASMLAPPRYEIEGIDLVSEGAVTLNQYYNVLEEDPEVFDEDSGVTQLHQYLRLADRVNILVGVAQNPVNKNIAFRQRGILPRTTIVPLIADKLRKQGKLVVVDYV